MKKIVLLLTFTTLLAVLSSTAALAVPSTVQYSTTKSFLEVLDYEDIRYTLEGISNEDDEVVRIGYDIGNTAITVKCYFDDDLGSCALRVWNFIEYETKNESWVIQALDALNREYRWLKFYSDPSDDSVTVSMDILLRNHAVGEICREGLRLVVDICDEAYSSLEPYNKNVG